MIVSMTPRTLSRTVSSIGSNQSSKSMVPAAIAAVFVVFFVMAWSPFRRSNAGISWGEHPGDYANRISTTSATGPPLKAEGRVTIQTGFEADYNLRTSSPFGEILHIIRVKITNATKNILTEARLSVANLNPANVGGRDFPLVCGIALAAGESTYVNVSSHLEG